MKVLNEKELKKQGLNLVLAVNKGSKNPAKLMSMVQNIGSKIDDKIKSGELKESELIAEATEIMNKMKTMPGMDNIQSMLGKMGLNGMPGGGKMNTGAMEAQLNKRLHMAKMKERMKAKCEAKAQQQQAFAQAFASTRRLLLRSFR